MNRIVFVTGGAGFIGSHFCKLLSTTGARPVVFDNLSTGHREAVKYGPLIEGDLRDADAVRAALETSAPDAVVNFAACAYVGESVEDPGKYYANNVHGMLNLLIAMRDLGIRELVHSSSCAVYGQAETLPITEECPRQPINPYGRSKLVNEWMVEDFADAHELRYVLLRYFNVAGADPEGDLVEHHEPETHILPRILMAGMGAIDEFEIFGEDYDTSDGTCIRDYVHVSDLARAHLLALDRLSAGRASDVFNIGSGAGFSVRELIQATEEVTGRTVPTRVSRRRPGDPPELVADPRKAFDQLGFAPRHGSIGEVVRTAWQSASSVHGTGS